MVSDARVTRYEVASPRWTAPPMTIAVLSDVHLGNPWTSLAQFDHWMAQTNALAPDLIIQSGDLLMDRGMWRYSRPASAAEIAERLCALSAPLGIWSVLGNHDWQDCDLARDTAGVRNSVIEALGASGLPLLENRAEPVIHGGQEVWLVGLGSRSAPRLDLGRGMRGHDDPDRAFAEVPDGALSVLIAHEPDIFAEREGPEALQISGHTHGGQIAPFGWRPVVPSKYGARFAYGHHIMGARHLVVSGGLGFSGLPLRVGVPPEIVLIHLRHTFGEGTQ